MDLQGLSSICAGLGIVEEDEDGNRIGYSKGAYCLDNLKDLLRFLRRDDPQTREVFKQVCKWNCVSKDLIPIIEHCREDRGLTLNSVKVLVFLTMPIEPMSSDIPQQIEYLWSLKSAITLSDTVAIIVSLLESPLENLESNAFTEDDWKLVQLVLTLFRNLLAIQDVSVFQKAAGSATQILTLRDRFLELLFRDSVMDLILIVTQHVSESSAYIHQDNWLLLEIFYYIFSGQDPELVARVHAKSVEDAETKASLNSLKSIIEEEKDKKRLSRLQSGACHSHFSGTFERLTMDGSKAVFKGNPHSASCDISIKPDKNYGGMRKKIVWDEGRLSTTTNTILKSLHDFVNQFLSGGYNVLVQSIRADIERENLNIQRSDIIYLFEVAKFVTSFQYHKFLTSKPSVEMDSSIPSDYYRESTQFQGSICGPIAASMNESMFLTVISKWRDAFDGLKETKEYKFLSVAGSTLKAMIRILDLVLKLLPEDSREPQTARVLLYKLFYDQTDQGMTHFLLNLIKSFDIHKQPKSDLADLVEVMHTVVELMERLQDRGTLRVSRKSRKVKKVNRLGDKAKIGREPSSDQHAVPNESGISDGEQLVNGDLHPEDGQFSADGNSGEKAVPLAGDKEKPDVSTTEGQNANNNVTCLCKSDHPKSSGYSSGDSSDDEQFVQYNEVDFRISTLLSAFANNGIIHNLCWLLKFYKSNCIDTNHYIISILRRITDDLELSPMLYQLSLLIVFHGILVEQKARPNMEYTEISEFLTNLVRKMLRKMKHQPLLFVEVLFWKTRKECQYIDAEYLLHEVGKLKKQFGYVENVSMMGEIGPTHATGWVSRSIADALGEDEADVVISHDLGNDEEFNESDIAAVPNLGMNGKANIECGSSLEHDYGEVSKRKGRLVLSHELDSKIRDLYAKFQNDKKCHQMIAEALDPHGKISAAQVGNKLKQLGLKISRRKRRPSDEPSSPVQFGKGGGEGEDAQERENLSQTHDFIHSLPRQPSHARKRVRALSEDQEGAIRTLFEKFKNHKRCSYMISNALDGDRIFTPAQIARKLKQLGLRVSRPKKDEGTLHLRNENLSNLPADKMQDSDDETLLSLRLRKGNLYDEGWFSSKLQNADSKGKSSEDDSDDETLSSVLKRSRKVTPLLKTKSFEDKNPRKNSTETTLLERDADDVTVGNATEGDQQNRPLHIEATGSQRTAQVNNLSFRASEVETTGNNLVEDLGSPTKEAADAPLEEVYDDLADSGDDLPPDVMARKKPVTGRRLRVVFDLEDDY